MQDCAILPSPSVSRDQEIQYSDVELVEQVRAGDDTAFEQLFNRHRMRVAQIASRFFWQHEQIEEIVQESFTKVYFGLSQFSKTKNGTFAGWLARISFNCCYDELRRIKRRGDASTINLSALEADWLRTQLREQRPEANIEANAIARDLAIKLCSRLAPEDRFVLIMLEVEEMSVAEIAKTLNWSLSKVKIRAFRARSSLRRTLKRFL